MHSKRLSCELNRLTSAKHLPRSKDVESLPFEPSLMSFLTNLLTHARSEGKEYRICGQIAEANHVSY